MTASNLVDGYLALTRQALTPSHALRERVQARLDVSPAAIAAGVAPLAAGEVPSVAAASQVGLVKLGVLLGGAFLALGFVGGYWARGIDAQPPPLPVRHGVVAAVQGEPREELAPAAAPDEAARRQLDAQPVPVAPSAHRGSNPALLRKTVAARVPSEASSSTRDELALLQRSERAVRSGDSALALMLLGEIDANYPRSELLEERRALELLAQCVAHASDSLRRAEYFLRAHPQSVYRERIGALCQAEPPASERP